jgi:hypothetical protein
VAGEFVVELEEVGKTLGGDFEKGEVEEWEVLAGVVEVGVSECLLYGLQ